MSKKSAKVEQGEETLKQIIQVAREMFSERGYANVSTTEIVKATGVTRGALYHHFNNKEALFRAVFENIQAEIGAEILKAAEKETDEWQSLIAGCEAFFRASLTPSVHRIVLIEAPSVLGWDVWRQVDEESTTQLLLEQLDTLASSGVIRAESTKTLAHLLGGAMNEGVLFISAESNQEEALDVLMKTLIRILNAFRT